MVDYQQGRVHASVCATREVSFRWRDLQAGGSTLSMKFPRERAWIRLDEVPDTVAKGGSRRLGRWWRRLSRGELWTPRNGNFNTWTVRSVRASEDAASHFLHLNAKRTVSVPVQVTYEYSAWETSLTDLHEALSTARSSLQTSEQMLSTVDHAATPSDGYLEFLLNLEDASDLPYPRTLIPRRCLWGLARSERLEHRELAALNPLTDPQSLAVLLNDPSPVIQEIALECLIARFTPYVQMWEPVSRSPAVTMAVFSPAVRERLRFEEPLAVDGVMCHPETGLPVSVPGC